MKASLTQMLQLTGRSIAAVVGCGGKTSLVRSLAEENQDRAVLISPTTQMYPMAGSVGVYRAETGKLTALPGEVLRGMTQHYDLTLLEADGSRGLPCKGWRADEPVVPAYCTHTIGVVTLRALGRTADEQSCLRLPLFLGLTGLAAGEAIILEALTRMVCAPEGMFRRRAGKCFLLVNQVEDAAGAALAREWLLSVREKHPGIFAGLLYGSLHAESWQLVKGE